MSLVVIRACFGYGRVVRLQRDGDGALLVRDARRSLEVTLRQNAHHTLQLLALAWNPQCLSLRVNDVVYDAGPVALGIGDQLRLCPPGAWDDAEGITFVVESGTVASPHTVAETAKALDSSRENAWRSFVVYHYAKVSETLAVPTGSPPNVENPVTMMFDREENDTTSSVRPVSPALSRRDYCSFSMLRVSALAFSLMNMFLAFLFAWMMDSTELAVFRIPAVERGWVLQEKAAACRRAGLLFLLTCILVICAPLFDHILGACRLVFCRLQFHAHQNCRRAVSRDRMRLLGHKDSDTEDEEMMMR